MGSYSGTSRNTSRFLGNRPLWTLVRATSYRKRLAAASPTPGRPTRSCNRAKPVAGRRRPRSRYRCECRNSHTLKSCVYTNSGVSGWPMIFYHTLGYARRRESFRGQFFRVQRIRASEYDDWTHKHLPHRHASKAVVVATGRRREVVGAIRTATVGRKDEPVAAANHAIGAGSWASGVV